MDDKVVIILKRRALAEFFGEELKLYAWDILEVLDTSKLKGWLKNRGYPYKTNGEIDFDLKYEIWSIKNER